LNTVDTEFTVKKEGWGMIQLVRKAAAYQPLTPGQRALLRLIEGLVCAALVAALPIVAGALGRTNVNWAEVGHAALAAAGVAVLLALAKYAKAHGDPALGDALTELGGAIGSEVGASGTVDGAGKE
jgi:hypothetical protein